MSPFTLPDGRELLTPEELIRRWPGVSLNALAIWRHRKDGPFWVKVKRHIYYPLNEVERWESASRRGTTYCDHCGRKAKGA